MQRKFLKDLGLEDEVIDKIMAEYGRDIQAEQGKTTKAEAELEAANTTIAALRDTAKQYEGVDVKGLQEQLSQAEEKHQKEIADMKFGYALDSALTGAKVRDTVAVKAHLDTGSLKLSEDGKIIGLDEQLTKLKETNDFLFESDRPTPTIDGPTPGVAGGKTPNEMTYTELADYMARNPGAEI